MGDYKCSGPNKLLRVTRIQNFLTLANQSGSFALRATSGGDFNLIDGFHSDGWQKISFVTDATNGVYSALMHLKDINGQPLPDVLCLVSKFEKIHVVLKANDLVYF